MWHSFLDLVILIYGFFDVQLCAVLFFSYCHYLLGSRLNDCILCPSVWTAFMHYLKHLLATLIELCCFFYTNRLHWCYLMNTLRILCCCTKRQFITQSWIFIGKWSCLNSFLACGNNWLQTFFFFFFICCIVVACLITLLYFRPVIPVCEKLIIRVWWNCLHSKFHAILFQAYYISYNKNLIHILILCEEVFVLLTTAY